MATDYQQLSGPNDQRAKRSDSGSTCCLATIAVVVCLGLLGSPSRARAVVILPDLAPGSQYHIVFVTSGLTTATSSAMAHYNNFVTQQAGSSEGQLEGLPAGLTWSAIVSTGDVNDGSPFIAARDNIGGPSDLPIYNTNGQLVANGTADLWDASLDSPINYNQWGDEENYGRVWTGTGTDGGIARVPTGYPRSLGMTWVYGGVSNQVDYDWVAGDTWRVYSGTLGAVYGFSSPQTVPGAVVPEPSSLLTFAGPMLILFVFSGYVRRRRNIRAVVGRP